MRTLLGYHLITAADWRALHVDHARQTEQIAMSGVALQQRDAALDKAYAQINALRAENARLLQDLAARDTTIAALSAKSARTARKARTRESEEHDERTV